MLLAVPSIDFREADEGQQIKQYCLVKYVNGVFLLKH
jgi:hypothetical protein